MSDQPDSGTSDRVQPVRGLWAIWWAGGAAVASALAVAGLLAVLPPLPGRVGADAFTGLVSVLGDLAARLGGMATLGGLAGIVAFTVPGEDRMLSPVGQALARWTGRSAQLWFVSALLMTFANPAFLAAAPIGSALRLDGWWIYLTSTPSALAWLAVAAAAAATAVVSYRASRTAPFLLCWVAGGIATVFVAVTGNASVGLDHDWATDAVAVATAATVLLSAGAVGVVRSAAAADPAIEAAVLRYHRAAPALLVVATAGYAVVAWQQLAGVSPFDVPAGLPVVVGLALLVAMLVRSVWWRLARRRHPVAVARSVTGVAHDVAALIGLMACLTAANHLPPPRFLVPQSTQVNYLGYEMAVPATMERLVSLGRPNLLWVLLSCSALGLYLWGMVRVRRGGGHWPVPRLLFWLGGWGLMLYLAVSGLWMYSTAVFSWHMLVHMTVNMLVPVLCVLGAPFGLVDAAARRRTAQELPGPREMLAGLAENRFVRVLLSPPLLWLNYIASLFLVYFTPLFPWLMKYHWAHQLMLLHFMVAGFAFFGLLVGPERHAWQLPHIVKFAILLSVMPFHAIFAVGIMMARTLIGADYYQTLAVTWVGDLMNDQNIAGQITWFTGEIPAFIAVIVLAAQWFRSDSADAAQADLLADAGADGEYDAYNEMLAQLADRDRLDHGGPGERGTR